LLLVLFAGFTARAQGQRKTVDRVVASIGASAITDAEIEAEYRFEMFLDGKAAPSGPDRATLERVRDRLIAQRLLAEQAAAEGTEPEDPPPSNEALDEVRQKFASPQAYQAALRSLGMDEQQVAARLAEQAKMLQMIEKRFRPSASPERAEIETYYRETFCPEFARRSKAPPPPLAEVENKIRDILVEKKIDGLLEAWLEEMKSSQRVKVHAF